jgi:diguanylate cyclase (GGDEF)-like protein
VATHNSVPQAVEAMKAGAYDYITTPFNTDELGMVILHALERKKLQEEVKDKHIYQEMAVTDSLTGLYNRRYFDELLIREEARAKRYPQQFSLLMIDIDDFKKFNDTYGHPSGDNILKTMGRILLGRIRNTDYVARYGGEEFCIIAPHTGKKNASVFAARLADIVAKEQFTLSDAVKASVTVSIGVANFNDDAQTKEELLQKSDDALYQAKKLGKNRVCLFGI